MISSVNNERMKRWNGTEMKLRKLGNGQWDKKLIERMIELSFSDNKEDALKEWKATGECWWPSLNGGAAPQWVTESQTGVGYCLCGHTIYYHFEIVNTETEVRECVGSDHINAYMIARSIAEELGVAPESISDDKIADWIKVRVKNMKADAWWEENGAWFNEMLEGLRPVDQWLNWKKTGEHEWDSVYRWHIEKKIPRKRAEGKFGERNYQMASVFWRWDNPDNSRNQMASRGYPNDALIADVTFLSFKKPAYLEHKKRQDKRRENRLEQIRLDEIARVERQKRYAEERKERARLQEIQRKKNEENRALALDGFQQSMTFRKMCKFYGSPVIISAYAYDSNSLMKLRNFAGILAEGQQLDEYALKQLAAIMNNKRRVTEKQVKFIKDLGGEIRGPITRKEASAYIETLIAEREGRDAEADPSNQPYSLSDHPQNRRD